MSERIMESQDEFVTRKYEGEENVIDSERQASFDDIGFNADLYIHTQEMV